MTTHGRSKEPEWCERSQRRLELLQSLPTNLGCRFGEPLSVPRIEAWEREAGIELPSDYRDFVHHVGNGCVSYGLMPLELIEPMVEEPWFDLERDEIDAIQPARFDAPFLVRGAWAPIEESPPTSRSRDHLYDGTLRIIEFGCNMFAFIVLCGEGRGALWYDETVVGVPMRPGAASFADWLCPKLDTDLVVACGVAAREALAAGEPSMGHGVLLRAARVVTEIVDPDANLAGWGGLLDLYLGDHSRARELLQRAEELKPSPPSMTNELREAIARAEKA